MITYALVTFATVVVRFNLSMIFSTIFSASCAAIRYDICVYIAYNQLTISSSNKLEQNVKETLWILYDNHKVIVQSSCYLHDLPI